MDSVLEILDPMKYHVAVELGGKPMHIAQSACRRYPIDANRNEHVRGVLEQMQPDYIMFLDGDMTHPPDTVLRLLAQQKDIVSGLYFYGGRPFLPVALVKRETDTQYYDPVQLYDDTPFMVDAIGMGCALIKADVFRTLDYPWFAYTEDNERQIRSRSEDMQFCESARSAGYEIWVDPTVVCGHIKTITITDKDSQPYRAAVVKRLERLKETDPAEYEKQASLIVDMRGGN